MRVKAWLGLLFVLAFLSGGTAFGAVTVTVDGATDITPGSAFSVTVSAKNDDGTGAELTGGKIVIGYNKTDLTLTGSTFNDTNTWGILSPAIKDATTIHANNSQSGQIEIEFGGATANTTGIPLATLNFTLAAGATASSYTLELIDATDGTATALTDSTFNTITATLTSGTVTVAGGTSAPTITSVSPNTGDMSSSVLVTITGTNFVDGSTTVQFGTQDAALVTVVDATTITCMYPTATTAGPVDVVVTVTGQTPATLTGGFEYKGASFEVTGLPDPATVGTPYTVTVKALDADGNLDTTYAGTASFTSTDTVAVITPTSQTFDGTSGTTTFTVTFNTVNSQTVTVTEGTRTGTQTVNVQAAPVPSFEVTGITDPATADTEYTVTVKALDASGSVNTAYTGTATFASTDTTAVITPTSYTFTGADNGETTFTVKFTQATTTSVSVSADDSANSMTGLQTISAVQAAPVPRFEVTGIDDPALTDTEYTVTVKAVKADGSTDTAYAGTATFASTDTTAVITPTSYTFTSTDNGTTTFTVKFTQASAVSVSVSADDSANSMTGSQTVAVEAGTATKPLITEIKANGNASGGTKVTLDATTSLASVFIEFTASDVSTGGSNIVKAEYYVDNDPGTGLAVNIPVTPSLTVKGSFTVVDLDGKSSVFFSGIPFPGNQITVRVQDADGNWSVNTSVDILVGTSDTEGPAISNVMLNSAGPDTATSPETLTATAGATAILTATVSDVLTGSSNITMVKYVIDGTDPETDTAAVDMLPADGIFNSFTENVTATINISSYTAGDSFNLKIKGKGVNWGNIAEYTVKICASAANFTYVINATDPMAIDFDLTGTDAGTGGTAMLDYDDGSAVADVTGSTSASHTYATAGTYHVILTSTDASGCAVKMEKDISVTGTAPVKGDANCDGKVDIFDALIIAEYDVLIIKTDILTNPGFGCADLATFRMNADIVADLNGEPNIFDALAIADCDSKSTDPATVASCVAAK